MGGTRLRPVGEGGHIIEDEGVPLAQRPALNFLGDGVVASDSPGKTDVTIPGGGGSGGGVWEKVAEIELSSPGTQIDIPISPAVTLADVSEIKVVAKVRLAVADQVRYEINNDSGLKYDSVGTEFTSGEAGPDVVDDQGFSNFGSGIIFSTTRPTYMVWYIAGLEPLAGLQGHIRESIGIGTFTDFLTAWSAAPPTTITNLRILTDGGQNFLAGSKATVYKLNLAGGGAGGGHVIEDEGTPLAQRADLNFVGAGVTAADTGGKTVVTIPGGGGGALDTENIALLREEFDWSIITAGVFSLEKYVLSGSGTETISTASFYPGLYGNASLTTGTAALTHIAEFLSDVAFVVEPFLSDITMTQVVLMRPPTLTSALVVCAMMGGAIGGVLSPTTDTNFFVENGEGFGFIFDPATSANWQIFSATGGSVTKTTTSVTAVAGATSSLGIRTKLRAIYKKSVPNINFEIDGVNVGTITTDIPNAATDTLVIYDLVANKSGAGFSVIELDMWEVQVGRDGDIPTGGGGGVTLGPQSVKPIDIAVSLDYKWLHDEFFYDNFTTFKQHGYAQDGIATPSFFNTNGQITCQTPGTGAGVQSAIVTLQSFGIKNPLLESDVYFRGIVTNRQIGSVDMFSNVGLISGSTNGSTTIATALDAMDDSIAFVVGNDDLFGRNWVAMTQVGTTRTLTDTGISGETVKDLEFRSLANGDIEFLIDGVVVATHSTNIPVGANLPFRMSALRAVGGPVKMDLRGLTIGVRN